MSRKINILAIMAIGLAFLGEAHAAEKTKEQWAKEASASRGPQPTSKDYKDREGCIGKCIKWNQAACLKECNDYKSSAPLTDPWRQKGKPMCLAQCYDWKMLCIAGCPR